MHILLVEDEVSIVRSLKIFLEEEGFVVTSVGSLRELNSLPSINVDLILLDIDLPDGNGMDIFRSLKDKYGAIIIYLSADERDKDIVTCLDMGADDYITKPFKINVLLSRIKLALRKNRQNVIRVSNVCVDLLKNRVLKNNNVVELSKVEYKIFVILLTNMGVVLNSRDILKEVWDTTYLDDVDNTLSVYIKRLRKKIEDDYNNPRIIKTVRTKGYVIYGGTYE